MIGLVLLAIFRKDHYFLQMVQNSPIQELTDLN